MFDLDSDLKNTSLDSHDPLYDSAEEEDEQVVLEETPVPSPFLPILKEYLVSGELSDAIKSLKVTCLEPHILT